ncbi:MAG: exosortase/archaeosortase family protein [Phycisphaerae bacterium]
MNSEQAMQSDAGSRPRRLVDMVADDKSLEPVQGWGTDVWAKVFVLAGVFIALHSWQFKMLYYQLQDPNWSHGFIIPLFSIYLLYCRYDQLAESRRRPSLLGLVILVGGLVWMVVSVYPIQNFWLSQLSMVVMLFGLVLFLAGWEVIRLTWLPIVYLVLALPIPDTLYNRIALPLQNGAAFVSAAFLTGIGVDLQAQASQLMIKSYSGTWYPVTVAEACSGVRSLMAFVALGVALAYLTDRPLWQRVFLLAIIIPVTVFMNMIRVTITCYMYVIDRPELGQKFMHTFLGMVMLIPAALVLWGFAKLLDALFVEEEAEEAGETAP